MSDRTSSDFERDNPIWASEVLRQLYDGFMRKLFLLLLTGLLQACALSRPIDNQDFDQTYADFSSGKVSLGGVRVFQSGVIEAKNRMRIDYARSDWADLSSLVIRSDFGIDLYWYYLGRSAEGLGFMKAATVYYRKALSTGLKCKDWTIIGHPPGFNECDGIRVAHQVNERLTALGELSDP